MSNDRLVIYYTIGCGLITLGSLFVATELIINQNFMQAKNEAAAVKITEQKIEIDKLERELFGAEQLFDKLFNKPLPQEPKFEKKKETNV
jgi:hypothetical protein